MNCNRQNLNRRDFGQIFGASMAGAMLLPQDARGQAGKASGISGVKAIVFDTFGTVVDWRGSIVAEGEAWGKSKGLKIDWAHFADRWREGYAPSMNKVRKGELPWTKLDTLHRMVLEQILKEFNINGLTEAEKEHWNLVWHRLKPWPDSVPGLARLKKKYTIAPLSNGNVSLLTDMGKNAGLPWDLILSAELAHHYKPDPESYLTAAELLSIKPNELMLGAAHSGDLNAARKAGLRTGFIYRPNEHGVGGRADNAKQGEFDVVAASMIDMAGQMGA